MPSLPVCPTPQLTQQVYDFDYDDDDDAEMDDAGGDIENQYYKAKCQSKEPRDPGQN